MRVSGTAVWEGLLGMASFAGCRLTGLVDSWAMGMPLGRSGDVEMQKTERNGRTSYGDRRSR